MGERFLPEVTPELIQKFIRHLEQKKTAKHGEKNVEGRTLKPASGAYRPVPYPSWARQPAHQTLGRSVRCSRSQRPVSVSQ